MPQSDQPDRPAGSRREQYANLRVLIVDDEQEIHDDIREMLRPDAAGPHAAGAEPFAVEDPAPFLPAFELLHATTGERACEIIDRGKQWNQPIAVAFVDIRMPPGIDGIETVRRVRAIDRDVEIVMMTAYTDQALPDIIRDMELLHKLLYIRKPFVHEEIQQIAVSLVGKWNVERTLERERRLLADSHGRLEAVLNATGDAMAMIDAGGSLVFANRVCETLLDLGQHELRALTPEELVAHCEQRFREPGLSEVRSGFALDELTGGAVVEATDRGKVPVQRLYYRSAAPVRDEGGAEIGTLLVFRDVSKEVEAEQMKAEVLRLRSTVETTYSFAGVVGTSAGMQRVYALMKQAAESDITVLVRGESGTGKELVAKSFHENSLRSKGRFVAVDCAAIPEALIESELFGHERGAFTGAAQRRTGAFERADGGTLMLDEIGNMPYALQGKLLRALQEREIMRLGGDAPISVDIRVVAATNKDLECMVGEGEFRDDLYYRIAAFPIVIPSLRDRREDIPLLARHFLDKHAARVGKSIDGLSHAALRLLLQYRWPGNVRELENTIERAVLLETGSVLQAGSLPRHLAPAAEPEPPTRAAAVPVDPREIVPLKAVERQAVAHALEATDHNITQAARALGINRATLHRKLKTYDLGGSDA